MKVFPVLCFIFAILQTSYSSNGQDSGIIKSTDQQQSIDDSTKFTSRTTKSTSGTTHSTSGTTQPTTAKHAVQQTKAAMLTFQCGATSKITSVTGLPLTELILIDGAYCHISDSNCHWKLSKIHLMHVPNEQDVNIAGGKNPTFYELECRFSGFIGKANVLLNTTKKQSIDYNSKVQTITPATNQISLTAEQNGITAKDVMIGDFLSLKFTGPDSYKIYPINCTAFASTVDGTPKHELWSNDTCNSKDKSILEDKWKHDGSKNNVIKIGMYAFRFVTSNDVAIECFAHFCPVSDLKCSNQCTGLNAKKRKRRDINKNNNSNDRYVQKVSTIFTVVENIGANTSSGKSTNGILLLTALSFFVALTR